MSTNRHVYHKVPVPLEGRVLYPLNQLREKKPRLYEQLKEKYRGREELLKVKIPVLDCLWNDVLHFSTIHPTLLYQALLETGHSPSAQLYWIKIPVEDLQGRPTCIYDSGQRKGEESFRRFEMDLYAELPGPPEKTLTYYRQCKQNGTEPLLFVGIAHLLLKGEINISSYDSFSWSQPDDSGPDSQDPTVVG